MDQDDRAPFDRALERARRSAYPPGEYVGQESFMVASEIRALARQAGIGLDVSVLDLCCGVGGPGRLLMRELGCRYLGLDRSASAIELARARAEGLEGRFEVAAVPPLPAGRFDVVLLLETMLAFPDKRALLGAVAGALATGGRFAFTVEEGQPLTDAERAGMPDGDTVWLVPLGELRAELARAGLPVRRLEDRSHAHLAMVERLISAYRADSDAIRAIIGSRALDDLLGAHVRWRDWLRSGRVRKLAVVAQRTA